ncbi:MAG: acetate--CoA ligase family protein [Minwuia sp.]|uniref:acetate--CoA ligase family protein n=1 Tax=Minwuia sp. TaxID=2493630 RepID=UPI003A8C7F2B
MSKSKQNLKRMFEAKSVAVIGASGDPLRIGGRPVAMIRDMGYEGALYPINPNRDEVQGLKAYPSIADVPGEVDLVICAVPGALVEDMLGQCAAKGVAGVIVFAGGFAEVGGDGVEAQKRLTAIARGADMRMIGPNCMGFANFANSMPASFHPAFARPMPKGNIGLVSQSGAFGGLSSLMAMDRGVGFRHVLTTGNEGDVGVADCLDYLVDDPGTEVILLYIEGVRDGPAFLDALAKARRAKKPVVCVKLGRTEAGAKAAASHTSALAGADAIYDAVFSQFGVHRVNSIEEFFDTGAAISVGGMPKGDSIALVTVSGGVGVLMADDAAARGMTVTELPQSTQKKFKEIVPYAGVNNPLDVTGQIINQPEIFEQAMRLVLDEGDYDAVVGFQGASLNAPENVESGLTMWKSLKTDYPDRTFAVASLISAEGQKRFEAAGIPTFREATHATRAMAAGAYFTRCFTTPFDWKPAAGSDAPLGNGTFTEQSALATLSAAGVPVMPTRSAASAGEAAAAAEELGFPVVMKILSPDIVHKSDVGGVKLNLASKADVEQTFGEMMTAVRAKAPDAKLDGVLLAPMISGGVETIIGVHSDPVFGPAIMFGLGGVFVEVLKDVSFRLAPFDTAEARRMIDEIRGRAILDGVRGAPAADVDALADALASLSQFAAAHRDRLLSVDVNPFVVLPKGQGAMALDAVIELKDD